MTDVLPFIIAGLTVGSVYALAGSGLVLTFKTSGIFNFGHGALATVGVYVFYFMYVEEQLPLVLCLSVSVLGVGVVLGLLMERLARSLATVPVGLQVAATVGIILVVQAGARLTFGSAPLFFPRYLPVGTVEVAGVLVTYEQIVPMAVALLATLALAVFFRWSRLGVAMRGVVDDPTLLAMTGTSPNAVRRVAWIVGSIFVCLSGVLLAPTVNLDSMVLTLLVMQSFGAAAIGRFSNIPLTYAGGLGIGVVAALITRYVSGTSDYFAGLSQSFPFIVLLLALMLTPRSKLVDRRMNLATPDPGLAGSGPAAGGRSGADARRPRCRAPVVRGTAVVLHRRAQLRRALPVPGDAGQELEPGLAGTRGVRRHRVCCVLGGARRVGPPLDRLPRRGGV